MKDGILMTRGKIYTYNEIVTGRYLHIKAIEEKIIKGFFKNRPICNRTQNKSFWLFVCLCLCALILEVA